MDNTEKAPQGQSEGAAPAAPVDQKTTKATKVAKVKTEAEAKAEALANAMKVGTLREVIYLLAIDAMLVGGVYAVVRTVGHRICVAYDIEVGWLVHLIESAVAGAVGVPVALIANKGLAALSSAQTAKGLNLLYKELQDQNQEATSRLLNKVVEDNKSRNEVALHDLRGDLDVALERLGEVRALAALAAEDAATATNRVLEIERRSAERIDEIAAAAAPATPELPALEVETDEQGVVRKFTAKELPMVKNLTVSKTPAPKAVKNGHKKTGTK
jgi:hypothetical protein